MVFGPIALGGRGALEVTFGVFAGAALALIFLRFSGGGADWISS